MVGPGLGELCPNCCRTAASQLDQLAAHTRPLHQVHPELQAWFFMADHIATERSREKGRHLLAALELTEAKLLRAGPDPWDSREARNQLAQLDLIREGWQR
jgi:hypothetical protein